MERLVCLLLERFRLAQKEWLDQKSAIELFFKRQKKNKI